MCALLGWVLADFEGYGFFLGGFLGLGAGAWLRVAVRQEIASALAAYEPSFPVAAAEAARSQAPYPAVPVPSTEEGLGEEVPADVVSVAPSLASVEPAVRRGPRTDVIPEPALVSATENAPAHAKADRETEHRVREPAPPSPVDQWAEAVRAWLLGGNTIVRAGLVILFVGLSFLARYAASAGLFPLEARLALVALAGVALLGVGLRKRKARPAFARALEGTGVAVLYLTVFAASRIFDLIPILPAFGFLIVFCALGCALALLENSLALALASFIGGFAVPVILGGESDAPLILFGYYTTLNLAILAIAWRRSWRSLNLLGFFVTFGMATLWGTSSYEPQHYLVTQIFLVISVAIYLATALFYAHNTPGPLGNAADSTLLFGTAIAGFGLQAGLVHETEFATAFSAVAFGAVYTACAALTLRKRNAQMRVMAECLIAIGVGFITLAIPLALDVRWTSAVWALEGAGAFWVGMRQARWMPRLFGLLLQAVAALIFLINLEPVVSVIPFGNPGFTGALLIALPVLAVAWWMRRPLPHSGSALALSYGEVERQLGNLLFIVAFLFICLGIGLEGMRSLPPQKEDGWPEPALGEGIRQLAILLGILGAMWLANLLGRKKEWPVATWPGRLSLPLLVVTFLLLVAMGRHVLYGPDWAAWLVAIAIHLHLLFLNDRAAEGVPGAALPGWNIASHVGTVWLMTAMLADCLQLGVDRGRLWNSSWAGVIFLVSATAVLMGLTQWAGRASRVERARNLRWPLRKAGLAYYWVAALPLVAFVALGGLSTALLAEGVTDPLPYIPLFNPVDLCLALTLVALLLWRRMIGNSDLGLPGVRHVVSRDAMAAIAVLGFFYVNSIWLRTAHHWLGVEWRSSALMEDFTVQAGLAIIWTLLAMVLMRAADRRRSRPMWLTGVGLLVLVVAKLLLVDMSNVGGWERIVTFIGVGLMMLVIGYFFPLPPKHDTATAREV